MTERNIIVSGFDIGGVVGDAPPGSYLMFGSRKNIRWRRADGRWGNSRKDEDPRHQWDKAESPLDGVTNDCLRCGRDYFELADEWLLTYQRDYLPDEDLRRAFEQTTCEGERRKREEWGR